MLVMAIASVVVTVQQQSDLRTRIKAAATFAGWFAALGVNYLVPDR